jgi:hypothetical protein
MKRTTIENIIDKSLVKYGKQPKKDLLAETFSNATPYKVYNRMSDYFEGLERLLRVDGTDEGPFIKALKSQATREGINEQQISSIIEDVVNISKKVEDAFDSLMHVMMYFEQVVKDKEEV